jgi:hypothetical protein
MQKLTGTSSCKNNKSCGIFYNESNKIGLAFFSFFYDVLYNLQETAKWFYYWSCHFAGRPSKRSFLLQCGPWGGRPARVKHNSGEARRSLAGEGLEEGLGVTRVRFGGSDGGGAAPASGHAGSQGRWPPRLPVSGEGGSGKTTGGSVGLGRG